MIVLEKLGLIKSGVYIKVVVVEDKYDFCSWYFGVIIWKFVDFEIYVMCIMLMRYVFKFGGI